MTESNSNSVENVVTGLTVSAQEPDIAPLLTGTPSTATVSIIRPAADEDPRVLLTVGQQDIQRHIALDPKNAQRLAHLLNFYSTRLKADSDGRAS